MTEIERRQKVQNCLNSIQAYREEIRRQEQMLKQLGYRGLV